MFSWVTKAIFGTKDSATATTDPVSAAATIEGRFYVTNARQLWECVLNDTTATLIRPDSKGADLEIVIASPNDPQPLSFRINAKSGFGTTVGPCGYGFTWITATDSKRVLFETERDEHSEGFKEAVATGLHEAKSDAPASVQGLQQLVSDLGDSSKGPAALSAARPAEPSAAAVATPTTIALPASIDKEKVSKVGSGDLYLEKVPAKPKASAAPNPTKPSLVTKDISIIIYDQSDEDYDYNLLVFHGEDRLISQAISAEMNAQFAKEPPSVLWSSAEKETVFCWSVVFRDDSTLKSFKTKFYEAMYEQQSQKPFPKAEKDRKWVMGVLAGESDDLNRSQDSQSEDEREEELMDVDTDDYGLEAEEGGVHNSSLAVGIKTDRSFVSRGSRIGVFKHDSDKLKYTTTIKSVKDLQGDAFSPRKLYLHDADTSMLLLNPDANGSIFRMDVPTGKVIEEWKPKDRTYTVLDIVPETKYSQATGSSTVIGINNCGFFVADSRTPEKLVSSRSFQYDGDKLKFRVGATTQDGHLALATAEGDIRYYNAKTLEGSAWNVGVDVKKPKARTTLVGTGDKALGLDLTADGEWTLATFSTYLLVFPNTVNDKNAFTGSYGLGQDKPSPFILRLNRVDIPKIGGVVNFTPAKFNVGGTETTIVTSTGPWILTWNFNKVKIGIVDQYTMKHCGQNVVSQLFKFNDDKDIVVALEDDVRLAKKVTK